MLRFKDFAAQVDSWKEDCETSQTLRLEGTRIQKDAFSRYRSRPPRNEPSARDSQHRTDFERMLILDPTQRRIQSSMEQVERAAVGRKALWSGLLWIIVIVCEFLALAVISTELTPNNPEGTFATFGPFVILPILLLWYLYWIRPVLRAAF